MGGKKFANAAWLQPGAWLQAVDSGAGDEIRTELTGKDQASEYLMMGLRVVEGIDIARLHKMCDSMPLATTVDRLRELGLLWKTDDRIGATQQGRLVLNSVITELLPD